MNADEQAAASGKGELQEFAAVHLESAHFTPPLPIIPAARWIAARGGAWRELGGAMAPVR